MLPLASHYRRVIGVDISDGMIAEARRNCEREGTKDVAFFHSVRDVQAEFGPVDLVNSSFVLQHIGTGQGFAVIGDLLDVLAPGGIAALHASFNRNFSLAREIKYQAGAWCLAFTERSISCISARLASA